ncbi:MAG: hypothetical protein R3B84_07895 [Zavarzinella sp.]
MALRFGLAMFTSAVLLFLVQPMIGKMILPLVGGSSSVWNTCMLFFQIILLLGYLYAHYLGSMPSLRKQIIIHGIVVVLVVLYQAGSASFTEPSTTIPIAKALAPQGSSLPVLGVLQILVVAIGPAFFLVSTTAPLLQKWFSHTAHRTADDPYFLYGASNLGSLIALLGYPLFIEPEFRVNDQAWIWSGVLMLFVGLMAFCIPSLWWLPVRRTIAPAPNKLGEGVAAPTWGRKGRWVLLAATASSLLLSVTNELTQDILSAPMLWIIPLSLYLLTFVIVFSKTVGGPVHQVVSIIAPIAVLLLVFLQISNVKPNLWIELGLNVFCFFILALMCHGELVRLRPSTTYLTQFYLYMSIGGMLGGLFNAIVAPVIFVTFVEYDVGLMVCAVLIPPAMKIIAGKEQEPAKSNEWIIVVIVGLSILLSVRLMYVFFDEIVVGFKAVFNAIGVGAIAKNKSGPLLILFGVPLLVSYLFVERPVRFAVCITCIFLGMYLNIYREEARIKDPDLKAANFRSYYGAFKIQLDDESDTEVLKLRVMSHGSTVHGYQHLYAKELSIMDALMPLGAGDPISAMAGLMETQDARDRPGRIPLSYYHRTAAVGDMFESFHELLDVGVLKNSSVACIGLGTGTLAAYGEKDQKMTFFEIDPLVRKVVEPPKYFTYLQDAKDAGVQLEFDMGDARLSLERSSQRWGMILVDAFSSDSIPPHLLTKQAVELYFNHVEENGIVGIHISNRYLNLEPVVERIATELGLKAIVMTDYHGTDENKPGYIVGKNPSTWIALTKSPLALNALQQDSRWTSLESNPNVGLWTDDYFSILKIFGK